MMNEGTRYSNILDSEKIRKDFPILTRQLNGRPLSYLDNAATSLKPQPVIDAVTNFYKESCANIHRGVHQLSQEASELYENARQKVAGFVNADEEEIIFVRNATEALNLICHSMKIQGDIIATLADHHSVYLPWFERKKIHYVDLKPNGELDINSLKKALKQKIGLVCLPHISNALGVINPVKEMIELVRKTDALIILDGSQSAPHMLIDVRELDCDFLVLSGHKMLAPSGIGVLYGKLELLDKMSPFLRGGEMNQAVYKDRYIVADLPGKFEAGTPNIEGAIGLGAAVDYLENIGMQAIEEHNHRLTELALSEISQIDKLQVYGPMDPSIRSSSISFNLKGLEAHGLAKILSQRYAIMVRSGYHCAQPLHDALRLPQTVRASFYLYNTDSEIRKLKIALEEISSSYTRSVS